MLVRRTGILIAILTLSLGLLVSQYYVEVLERSSAVDIPVERIPLQLARWTGRDSAVLDLRSRGILKLDRFIKRDYSDSTTTPLFLYIGYWKKQTGEYQAAKHSPLLCLPSNGWHIQQEAPSVLSFPEGSGIPPIKVKRIIGETGGRYFLFYYWFFAGLDNYTEEWQALLKISAEKMISGRSDGGIIEISAPLDENRMESIDKQSKIIEEFARSLYPELYSLLRESTS